MSNRSVSKSDSQVTDSDEFNRAPLDLIKTKGVKKILTFIERKSIGVSKQVHNILLNK